MAKTRLESLACVVRALSLSVILLVNVQAEEFWCGSGMNFRNVTLSHDHSGFLDISNFSNSVCCTQHPSDTVPCKIKYKQVLSKDSRGTFRVDLTLLKAGLAFDSAEPSGFACSSDSDKENSCTMALEVEGMASTANLWVKNIGYVSLLIGVDTDWQQQRMGVAHAMAPTTRNEIVFLFRHAFCLRGYSC
jgi:hypothetical protein